ncbi:hypothetical protein BC830DRAFT_1126052 [Chytriomyces sp. MP71]|nr:hypothetical protein BC830DRAFT_1126052 [Chytriomyces sp. MP71]
MTGSTDVHHFHRENVFQHTNKQHPTSRTIMVAVDDSKHSNYAFQWYLNNVAKAGDLVYLVNVYQPAVTPGSVALEMVHKAHLESIEVELEKHSHELVKRFCDEVVKHHADLQVVGLSLRGGAGAELLVKSEELGCEVIVVGARGLTALERAALGSTSEFLVHNATTASVVVCKMPDTA